MAKTKVNPEGARENTERRNDVISRRFTLVLDQPKDTFRLEAWDAKGDRYILSPATISDEPDLIPLMLRRIANAKGRAGWKFDATYFPDRKAGVIIG